MHQFKYGRDITRLYRNFTYPHEGGYQYGNNVTFPEFVRYLTDPQVPYMYKDNPHWTRYYSLCPVCHGFRPDFILSFDNFQEDVSWALKLLFRVNPNRFIDIHENSSGNHSSNVYKDLIHSLPNDLRRKLFAMFEIDFNMYDFRDVTK